MLLRPCWHLRGDFSYQTGFKNAELFMGCCFCGCHSKRQTFESKRERKNKRAVLLGCDMKDRTWHGLMRENRGEGKRGLGLLNKGSMLIRVRDGKDLSFWKCLQRKGGKRRWAERAREQKSSRDDKMGGKKRKKWRRRSWIHFVDI